MLGRKICIGAGVAALAVLLAACTALPGGASLVGGSASDRHLFRGLTSDPQAQSEPSRRYIFHIHGMGITDQGVFHRELHQLLARRYRNAEVVQDWTPAPLKPAMRVNGELLKCDEPWFDHLDERRMPVPKPCEFPSFGEFRIDRFSNGSQEVVLYTYFWHRDLWRIQEPHLRADMQRHAGTPAFLNSYLKHDTLDGGISDAAAYVGPAGQLVRAGISSVLCAMARDAARPETAPRPAFDAADMPSLDACGDIAIPSDVQFGFVTHSLGSRMLYDVLAPRSPGGQVEVAALSQARVALIQRTDVVYMAANQLPLLALGRVGVEEVSRTPPPPGAAPRPECISSVSLLEARRRLPGGSCGPLPPPGAAPLTTGRDLQIVAFADPDDILGYRAGDAAPLGDRAANGGAFIDIVHRNAGQLAWSLTLPNLAHDHELKRRETQDMILCGATVARGGKVRPYPCPRAKPR